MGSLIGSLIRKSVRGSEEPLNILTFPTHERYESLLAKTKNNFYSIEIPKWKKWNTTYEPIPNNYSILKTIPADLDFDLVFTLAKHQYSKGLELARALHLPLLCLEVFVPQPGISKQILEESKTLMRGHANVFINRYSRDIWGWDGEPNTFVIEHGIDTDIFKPADEVSERIPHILSCVNDWANRDWSHGYRLYRHITRDLPVLPLGDTPGLSRAVSFKDLVRHYQESAVYVNTTLEVPVPTALLEAMACGCAIVTTGTGGISDFIVDGVNGFISNDPERLRSCLQMLLDDPELCSELGGAARQTILEKFSLFRFIYEWQVIFRETAKELWLES